MKDLKLGNLMPAKEGLINLERGWLKNVKITEKQLLSIKRQQRSYQMPSRKSLRSNDIFLNKFFFNFYKYLFPTIILLFLSNFYSYVYLFSPLNTVFKASGA